MTLGFGYNAGLPDGVEDAWGARFIVTQDGGVDFLADRQSFIGDGDRTIKPHLMEHFTLIVSAITEKLRNHEIDTRHEGEVIVYEIDGFKVVGNSNGSGGYFYVAAFIDPTYKRAIVRNVEAGREREQVEAYLDTTNYKVLEVLEDGAVLIGGTDVSGWTLDAYVIPRLASGLLFAEEVTS